MGVPGKAPSHELIQQAIHQPITQRCALGGGGARLSCQVNVGVTMSWMRSTVRVMGCSCASRASEGKEWTKPRIWGPAAGCRSTDPISDASMSCRTGRVQERGRGCEARLVLMLPYRSACPKETYRRRVVMPLRLEKCFLHTSLSKI